MSTITNSFEMTETSLYSIVPPFMVDIEQDTTDEGSGFEYVAIISEGPWNLYGEGNTFEEALSDLEYVLNRIIEELQVGAEGDFGGPAWAMWKQAQTRFARR